MGLATMLAAWRRVMRIGAELELAAVAELVYGLLGAQADDNVRRLRAGLQPPSHPCRAERRGRRPAAVLQLADEEACGDRARPYETDFDLRHEHQAAGGAQLRQLWIAHFRVRVPQLAKYATRLCELATEEGNVLEAGFRCCRRDGRRRVAPRPAAVSPPLLPVGRPPAHVLPSGLWKLLEIGRFTSLHAFGKVEKDHHTQSRPTVFCNPEEV